VTHAGVRIRLSIPAGVIYDCDSVMAHYQAAVSERAPSCGFACLPGCDAHGWVELTRDLIQSGDLKVEVKAVHLADPTRDDEPDDDDPICCPRCECSCGAR